ncbi:DUF2891 domain-containing protein [Streptomyces sp. NBC_00124]|nr:DUF2891 domain-containing protein [Streptomyces sp. NBC_00140]MCX5357398.1 DUF2891 domain-containing protein [Streptomyces sp. NBC_00124]
MTPTWAEFTAARDSWLRQLALPIQAAVARADTGHPAFHGCMDWHSSIHGTFALLAVSRLTGDLRFRGDALTALGGREPLESEVDDMRSGRLAAELPYGFAWALQLDVEAARSDIELFHDIGIAAREQLVPYMSRPGDLLSTTYRSPIWAAYCLHRWATAFNDQEAAAAAENFAATMLPACGAVPVGDGFLSPSHLAVLLAQQVGMSERSIRQPLHAVRETKVLGPGQITSPYRAGLNFSRAWGCQAAWTLTGDPVYRASFVALVSSHLKQPTYWADHYPLFGHWVAQFGVFAIHLTEET